MTTRKKVVIDFEYEAVLDEKVRRLIQLGCAVAVGCPT
jgi:alkylhydroperoxidase/carboxymuconolactone decarboxylase family protein YurZ